MNIAKLVSGSEFHQWDATPEAQKYWNSKYRLEAIGQLRHL